ncbi:hypothetical protein HDU89_002440 [Geranomyces variabilis]|nr:hypothetical protein HDU89_002440 [Geranomyces variabilis]KAJ3166937.1 hypothetical protein HDU88_003026 [Geranomyces variabilis]
MQRRSPLSTDAVTIGREHGVPLLGHEIASPVANIDTVPSMNLTQKAFNTKFHVTEEAFRDLARFEARMKLCEGRGRRSQRRWQGALAFLLAVLVYCSYCIATNTRTTPQGTPLQSPLHVFGLTTTLSIFIIFAASGALRAKILDASAHVDRCNASLAPFNMRFSPSRGLGFAKKVPPEFQEAYERYRDKERVNPEDVDCSD